MRKYVVFVLLVQIVLKAHAEVTPEVDIMEENPPRGSSRVVTLANNVKEIRGLIGENVVMECQVFNKAPGATIIWKRIVNNQVEVISDTFKSRDQSKWRIGQGKQQDSVRLEIMALDLYYEGNYSCEVQYSGSIEPAKDIRRLKVWDKPSIRLDISSFNMVAKVGETVVLNCYVRGIPEPTVMWRRVGGETSLIPQYGLQALGNKLTFNHVESVDAGTYACTGTNVLGHIDWKITLSVIGGPTVRIYPDDADALQKVGCNLEFICIISSNPPVDQKTIAWSSNKEPVQNNSRIKMRTLSVANKNLFFVLSFEPVISSDLGKTYMCTAQNTIDTASDQVTLTESSTALAGRGGMIVCNAGLHPRASLPATGTILFTLLAAAQMRALW